MTPNDRQIYDLMAKAPGYMMQRVMRAIPESASLDEREAMLRLFGVAIRQYLAHRESRRDEESGT